MDGYRQSLLGRALADVLQTLETDGVDGDEVFALFDAAAREELAASLHAAAASRRRRAQDDDAQASDAQAPPAFSHATLALSARLLAFNRFEDRWSLQAAVPSGALALDGEPVRWASHANGSAADEQQEGEEAAAEQQQPRQELLMLARLQQLDAQPRT